MKFFMAQKKKMCGFGYVAALILAVVLVACGGNSGGNETTYLVVYDGNGADDGSVPVDAGHYEAGQTVTILGNTGDLVRAGYSYAGWNTEADGSGTTYTQDQTFTIGAADAILYARWSANVAYIYGDNTAAENFKTLLDPTYPTDLILKANIESTDFTKYSLIIIGRGGAPVLTPEQVATIHNTNLMVIGISGGGLDYFGKIGLGLNGGNVASGSTTQAIVINAASPIWSFPNLLDVSDGSAVTIFNSNSSAKILYKPNLDADGIHIAGYNISYDTIAQVGINLYWAYYNDASDFTETGQKLFINAVAYMTQ